MLNYFLKCNLNSNSLLLQLIYNKTNKEIEKVFLLI